MNDSRVASGSLSDIRVWDAHTGDAILKFGCGNSRVRSLNFSPDGCLLAFGSDDNAVQVVDIRSRQVITTLRGHHDWVKSVIFSSDGRYIFSRGNDDEVLIWNATTFAPLQSGEEGQGRPAPKRPRYPWEQIFHYDDSTGWLTVRNPGRGGQYRRLCWIPYSRRPFTLEDEYPKDPIASSNNVVAFGSESGIVTIIDFSTHPYFVEHADGDDLDTWIDDYLV
jgi:WD40 repeat protein